MLYVRADKPVEPVLLELLSHVNRVAGDLHLAYFVGGAFARDLILLHVYGFDVPHPTRDVDIGIAVRNWEEFEKVKERLIGTGKFSPVNGVAHKLTFLASPAGRGVPLDVLPFAGVEEPGSVLRWPPDREVEMNLAGFEEAHAHAEQVQISDAAIVRVASLPGQVLLKLSAWLDRRAETPRDALDLSMMFRRYGDAGNMDRLYEEESELLEATGFDIERAGATLLGQDVRAIASPQSYERLPASSCAALAGAPRSCRLRAHRRAPRAQAAARLHRGASPARSSGSRPCS